jgi:hypothetical protein
MHFLLRNKKEHYVPERAGTDAGRMLVWLDLGATTAMQNASVTFPALVLAFACGAALQAQAAQVSERLAGQLVDESLVSVATNGSLADLARELAAARIPAGFVFSSDDRRITWSVGETAGGRTERLGSVLAALAQRRPDLRAHETRGVLLVAPAESICLAPLDRLISNLDVDILPVTHALTIIRRHLDPTAPSGPPGLARSWGGSAEPPERAAPGRLAVPALRPIARPPPKRRRPSRS